MATVLLASGTAAATSADFTLAAGDEATLCISSENNQFSGHISIEYKSADNSYVPIGRLTWAEPGRVVAASGTYRVRRGVVSQAIGVDRD